MKLKLFVLILFVLSATFLHAQFSETITWEKTVIDCVSTGGPGGIAFGSPYIGLTPTNQNYLYCASMEWDLVEYSYVGNQWLKKIILPEMSFEGITIGPGRNDSNDRIYCYRNKELYEIWCENEIWSCQLLFEITESQFEYLIIGDGRNDGVNRIYISNNDRDIFELTYTGPGHNDWEIEIINQDMHSESIGKGRNDDINRIYGFGGNEKTIYELTYNISNNSYWNREVVWNWEFKGEDCPGICWGVSLGKTRTEDELNRIYYVDVFGDINEVIFEDNSWENIIVNPPLPVPLEEGYGASLSSYGRPFSFGIIEEHYPPLRLIFINADNSIYYFINYNGNWSRHFIGEIGRFIDIVYGDVRISGDYALYLVSFIDGHLIEFYPQINKWR